MSDSGSSSDLGDDWGCECCSSGSGSDPDSGSATCLTSDGDTCECVATFGKRSAELERAVSSLLGNRQLLRP